MKRTVKYSIVVPLCNERGNVLILDKQIKQIMDKISPSSHSSGSYEIIYVNDGLWDKSLQS